MKKGFKMVVRGLAGIGLVDGMASIYISNAPRTAPVVRSLSILEARLADGNSLAGDFSRVMQGISSAAKTEMERGNG